MWGGCRTFGFSKSNMRFSGTISAKLDAKGRVFLPSDFRKQLAESDTRLVLRRDVYQPCLVIYPHSVWNMEVDGLRSMINRWSPREAMLFRLFMADAEQLSLDGNGRFLIPKRYLQACTIDHDVQFVGVDDRIEIWSELKRMECFPSPEQFAQSMEELSAERWNTANTAIQ